MTEPSYIAREYEIGEAEFLVLVSDKASQFVYANPAYLKASGFSAEELKGQLTSTMLHRDTPKQLSMDMMLTLKSRQPWTGIIKNQRKNGDYYWLRLNISPLYAEGRYAGALLVHSKPPRDEVKRLEPIYKRMREDQNSNLILHHGQPLRLNLWTRLLLQLRSFGLHTSLWGGMAAIDVIALITLLTVAKTYTVTHWLALAAFVGFTSLLGYYFSTTIVGPLRRAVAFANQTAAGDLTSQMASTRSDEIGNLIRALTQMNMNMRATVVDVRDGVNGMQAATAEIALGAIDLSGRTSHQAAHLETTAASMEEINATIKETADASRQASQLVKSACSAAETGGQVISEVVDTMQGITQSSKKIAEIIGVIDSIAFQTNILALNAAVEAARAGEQGRGFAVVAGEVRNLAQRSAQSAREIRELIVESVKQVEEGAKLVNAAGKTIDDVVTQVRRVTSFVGRIADASLEQAAGIGQINDGIANLEQVTQQNSDLVDESTASAASLRAQAEQLAAAVAVFKLSKEENLALFNATAVRSKDARASVLITRAA
ncbi:MAG: PAS domain S-box protein [Candidatus Obscuribacterales bacterium]|nr:PAS domain S-box protein [Steroidobacteraceae bacterium]